MKAAVFYKKDDLRIEELPIPTPAPDEVLIKVSACGICGTDMHIFDGDEGSVPTPAGTVLGHEYAGEVVSVGKKVTSIKAGDRVCVDPNILCGECDFCRDAIGNFCDNMIGVGTMLNGGFAEYCCIPQSQIYKFSSSLSYEAAAMTEPVACCLHGMDLCDIEQGDVVAIIGGGMIGLIMLQLAKYRGASRLIVIEPIASKREHALSLGADIVIDPFTEDVHEVLKKNGIARISTVIECVGKPATIEQAISIAGKKSTVMMFGLTKPNETISIKPFEIFKKEIVLKASYVNPYTQRRALALVESGRLDVTSMVVERASIDELPAILADKARRSAGKILITF